MVLLISKFFHVYCSNDFLYRKVQSETIVSALPGPGPPRFRTGAFLGNIYVYTKGGNSEVGTTPVNRWRNSGSSVMGEGGGREC